VFEGIRFYETDNGPAIFRANEHIERLVYSAKTFGMDVPHSKVELISAMCAVVKANKLSSGYIRPLIFYGDGNLGVDPTGAKLIVMIAAWEWGSYFGKEGLSIKTSEIIRIHPKSTDVNAKISGVYQNSIQAGMQVKAQGYDDALLLDYEGNIAEGPSANFFVVKDGIIYTPATGSILPGITRATVISLAQEAGYEVVEEKITLDEVYGADEAFFCGTAAEVTPILSLDDHDFVSKERPVTSKLKELYSAAVHGKSAHSDWVFLIE